MSSGSSSFALLLSSCCCCCCKGWLLSIENDDDWLRNGFTNDRDVVLEKIELKLALIGAGRLTSGRKPIRMCAEYVCSCI